MTEEDFSTYAVRVGKAGLDKLDPESVSAAGSGDGIIWLHCSGDIERTQDYLHKRELIPGNAVAAICGELTRPRFFVDEDKNTLLTLRTTRETPAFPQDYMSLRMYATPNLIVSVSLRVTDIVAVFLQKLVQSHNNRESFSREKIFLALCDYISEDFTDYIATLDENINALEDNWDDKHKVDLDTLIATRQKVSRLSRYMTPQYEAVQKIAQYVENLTLPAVDKKYHHQNWPQVQNGVRRDIEALTEMRERLSILQDTLQQFSSEKINRTMYMLSIVATFFLPLTFVTGVLGMNVAGIPASDYPKAFWVVCGLMLAIAVVQWILFKRWQWLR